MTGEVAREQMIEVEGKPGPRRDIALWSRIENNERPEHVKVQELISDKTIDRKSPTFGIEL